MKIKHSSDHNTAFLGLHRDKLNSGYFARRKRSCACRGIYDNGRQKMFARSLDEAMRRITDGISQWKSLSASCLAFLKSFIAAIFNILQKVVTFGNASSFKGDCRNVSAAATIAARPPPKMNILSHVTIALFAMFFGLTSCSKSDSADPVEPTPIEVPVVTTSPVSIEMKNMIEELGLATVSTKSYSPKTGDIKSITYFNEADNVDIHWSLIEEESNEDELVYWQRKFGNGNEIPPKKVTITKQNNALVADYQAYNGWGGVPTYKFKHKYYMQDGNLIKESINDEDEWELNTVFKTNSPTSLDAYTPDGQYVLQFQNIAITLQK